MHQSHSADLTHGQGHSSESMPGMHYMHLGIMALASFVAMYFLMYAMVDRVENVFMSFNQVYMAGLMTAPMVLIELIVMRAMYADNRLNMIIGGASAAALIAFFLLIRQQALIYDSQFLRSMISHHASAILMCEQAPIRDVQIKELCGRIIASQQSEISEMKAKLKSMSQ